MSVPGERTGGRQATDEATPDDVAGIRVITLSGELDASDDEWLVELESALASSDRVIVDLRNVSFIDSSVVRALVVAHRKLSRTGWLRLVYTHHLIRRVITICGLADRLPQYTTIEAAERGFAHGGPQGGDR